MDNVLLLMVPQKISYKCHIVPAPAPLTKILYTHTHIHTHTHTHTHKHTHKHKNLVCSIIVWMYISR